jgi:hypothetical protein
MLMMKTTSLCFCLLFLLVFPVSHAPCAQASSSGQANAAWRNSWPEFCKTITGLYAKGAKEEDFKFMEGQHVSWQGGEILEVSTGGEFEDFNIYVNMPECKVKRPDGSSAEASSLLIAYDDEGSLKKALSQIGISNPEHFKPLENVSVSATLQTGSSVKGKFKSPIRWVTGTDATTGEPYAFIQINFGTGTQLLHH